jgi:hypothetical protein
VRARECKGCKASARRRTAGLGTWVQHPNSCVNEAAVDRRTHHDCGRPVPRRMRTRSSSSEGRRTRGGGARSTPSPAELISSCPSGCPHYGIGPVWKHKARSGAVLSHAPHREAFHRIGATSPTRRRERLESGSRRSASGETGRGLASCNQHILAPSESGDWRRARSRHCGPRILDRGGLHSALSRLWSEPDSAESAGRLKP